MSLRAPRGTRQLTGNFIGSDWSSASGTVSKLSFPNNALRQAPMLCVGRYKEYTE